jgi:hypothetical protein
VTVWLTELIRAHYKERGQKRILIHDKQRQIVDELLPIIQNAAYAVKKYVRLLAVIFGHF